MMIDWLKKCHISDFIISSFNISVTTHPHIGDCITIPIYNTNGTFAFNKYRRNPTSDLKPKYLYDKGSHVTLYGSHMLHTVPVTQPILITEGEKDTLVAWSQNIPAVTSTGGALSFQEEWKTLLANRPIIICYDNDQAGGEGMVRTLAILPHAKLLFLPDRAGIKDISDYTANGGDLNELIKTATHLSSYDDVLEDRALRISKWQSTYFHDAYIAKHNSLLRERTATPRTKDTTDRIQRAKQYPITNFPELTFIRGKAKCVWHNDNTPSMHYYKTSNTVYCFSCGKFGDSIAVYRQIHGCTFKEAVDNCICEDNFDKLQ